MASPRSTPLACRPGWDQLPPGRSEPEAYGQGPCAPWGRSRRVFWTGTRVASPKSPGEEVTLGRWAARRLDAASRHTCSPTATAMPTSSAVKSPAPLAVAEVVERLLAQPQSGSAANPGQQRLTAAGAKRLGEISTRGGSREADSAVQDAADHDARPCSRCHAVGRQHGCTTGIASASIQCLIPPLSSLHPDVPPAGITRTCQQHLSETPCRASLLWPKQQTARGFHEKLPQTPWLRTGQEYRSGTTHTQLALIRIVPPTRSWCQAEDRSRSALLSSTQRGRSLSAWVPGL